MKFITLFLGLSACDMSTESGNGRDWWSPLGIRRSEGWLSRNLHLYHSRGNGVKRGVGHVILKSGVVQIPLPLTARAEPDQNPLPCLDAGDPVRH